MSLSKYIESWQFGDQCLFKSEVLSYFLWGHIEYKIVFPSSMVFTRLLLENSLAVRPYNYEAATEPHLQSCPFHTSSLSVLYEKMQGLHFYAL